MQSSNNCATKFAVRQGSWRPFKDASQINCAEFCLSSVPFWCFGVKKLCKIVSRACYKQSEYASALCLNPRKDPHPAKYHGPRRDVFGTATNAGNQSPLGSRALL